MKHLTILSISFFYVFPTLIFLKSVSCLPTDDTIPLLSLNASFPSDANFSTPGRPAFLPHTIRVPNSPVSLNLGFGFIRRSLLPSHLNVLLSVVRDYLDEQIKTFGADTVYPVEGLGTQHFSKTLGDGVHVEVWNLDYQARFTWGILADVIEGLWLFLVQGLRYWQCWFEVFERPRASIAAGRVFADVDDDRSA